MLKFFFSQDFVEPFFENLLRHKVLETHLSPILNSLLQAILQKIKSKNQNNDLSENSDNNEEIVLCFEFDETLFYEHLVPKIGDIAEYFQEENNKEFERTYGGEARKPFGLGKLKLLEAIQSMIELNRNKISMEIGSKKLFSILW